MTINQKKEIIATIKEEVTKEVTEQLQEVVATRKQIWIANKTLGVVSKFVEHSYQLSVNKNEYDSPDKAYASFERRVAKAMAIIAMAKNQYISE